MRQYVGLVHKEAASDYDVSFPDFPGVVTVGATLDEVRVMAQEALAFHIEGWLQMRVIPEPSDLEEVMANPVNRDGVAMLVAVETEARKAVLAEIDRYVGAHGFTRSGFLVQAVRQATLRANDRETSES
jgi:predicted RNase H-like HicB family nuclease